MTRFTIAAILMLAACGKAPERNDGVDNAIIENVANNDVAASVNQAEAETPVANNGSDGAPAAPRPAANTIPADFHGRWGMVSGDCGADAGLAKGRLTIDGAQLRFYESVGTPAVVTYPTPNRMQGRFTFSGEGMEWGKDMVLTLQGDGDKLVRTEKDPVASYTYMRCPG